MGRRDPHSAPLLQETSHVKRPHGATSLGLKRTRTVLLSSVPSPPRSACPTRDHRTQGPTRSRSQQGHKEESALVFRSQRGGSADPPAATHRRRHLPGDDPGYPLEKDRQYSLHLTGQTVRSGRASRPSHLVPVPPHRASLTPTVPLPQGKSLGYEVQETTSVRTRPWYCDHPVLTQIRAKTSRRSPGHLSPSTTPIVPEPANQTPPPAKAPVDPETRVLLVAQ